MTTNQICFFLLWCPVFCVSMSVCMCVLCLELRLASWASCKLNMFPITEPHCQPRKLRWKVLSFIIFRQGLMNYVLASNLVYGLGWPWTLDFPSSTPTAWFTGMYRHTCWDLLLCPFFFLCLETNVPSWVCRNTFYVMEWAIAWVWSHIHAKPIKVFDLNACLVLGH